MFFLTCFTQYCLSFYDKVFSLFWLNIKLFKVSILNSQIFLWPVLLLLWTKVIYNEVNNKNIIKRRRSRPEVFCKKGVVRNVAKFTGKQLYQSLFPMAQVFSCEFREMLKNTFSYGTSPVAASENGIKNGIFSLQHKHKFGIMLKNTGLTIHWCSTPAFWD